MSPRRPASALPFAALALSLFSAVALGQSADTATVTYEASGVKVIQRILPGRPVIAVNLYLLGGVRQATPTTAGLEPLLLDAAEGGTLHYPGGAAHRAALRTGSEMLLEATKDWTVVGFRGVRENFDSTWAVFADRITHPTLDQRAVDLTRLRYVEELRRRQSAPDARLRVLADSLAFAGHPYALSAYGSEASLVSISAADLRRYATEQLVTSRMLLVVVGDVSREHLAALVAATLGQLPQGHYVWSLPPLLPSRPPAVLAEHRELPTGYLLGYCPGPAFNSPDFLPFQFALGRVASHMDFYIRQSNSLSYAAGAYAVRGGATAGALYVSTPVPSKVIPFMRASVAYAQNEPVMNSELRDITKQLIDDLQKGKQGTTASQADALGMAQLYRGDYRVTSQWVDQIRKVAGEDVLRVARVYLKNFQFVYLGDTAKIERKKFEKF